MLNRPIFATKVRHERKWLQGILATICLSLLLKELRTKKKRTFYSTLEWQWLRTHKNERCHLSLPPKKPTCCIRTHTQIIHPYTNKFCNTGQSSAPLCCTDWTLNLKCAWSVSQNNSAFHVFQYWFMHKHANMSKFIYPVACLSALLYTEKISTMI